AEAQSHCARNQASNGCADDPVADRCAVLAYLPVPARYVLRLAGSSRRIIGLRGLAMCCALCGETDGHPAVPQAFARCGSLQSGLCPGGHSLERNCLHRRQPGMQQRLRSWSQSYWRTNRPYPQVKEAMVHSVWGGEREYSYWTRRMNTRPCDSAHPDFASFYIFIEAI